MLRHCRAPQRRYGPDRSHAPDLSLDDFFEILRSRIPPRGEARLALAVLEDAVSCLNGNQDPWKVPPRLFRWEAEQWIASRDRGSLFSFVNVCSILGLDAEDLRGRIRDWRADHEAGLGARSDDRSGGGIRSMGS